MATLPTIPTIIGYAKIVEYLCANDTASRKALNWGYVNSNLAKEVYEIRKSVQWAYTNNPNNSTLTTTSQYLYSLLGRYLLKAELTSGNQGGSIVNPAVVPVLQFFFLQFQIGQAGSLMTAGSTTLTLDYPNITANSVNVAYGGSPLPQTSAITSGQQSYLVSYSINTSVLTFANAVNTGDFIVITGSYLST
jgi:hypothetical protein